MLKLRGLFFSLTLLAAASASHYAAAQTVVRVLLEEVQGTVTYTMPAGHRGYVDGRLVFSTPLPLAWPMTARGGKIYTDGSPVGRSLMLEPAGQLVRWRGNDYRGAINLVAVGNSLQVINVLDLEDYLRGVVPSEMPANWPLEALKAQAVAARTYTLTNLKPAGDYDICATTDCQVYSGVRSEHARSDQAIRETAGLTLTYANAFARTYYHADSGGYVASSAEVWGNPLPYLPARSDVSAATPHRHWEHRLNASTIAGTLRGRGVNVGTVQRLEVTQTSESGRVREVIITGDRSRARLSGEDLTSTLRSWGLKSTRFTMVADLTARGDGWGHGVGMSQYGAMTMASENHSFEQILAFYYPNTYMQRLPTHSLATVH